MGARRREVSGTHAPPKGGFSAPAAATRVRGLLLQWKAPIQTFGGKSSILKCGALFKCLHVAVLATQLSGHHRQVRSQHHFIRTFPDSEAQLQQNYIESWFFGWLRGWVERCGLYHGISEALGHTLGGWGPGSGSVCGSLGLLAAHPELGWADPCSSQPRLVPSR